MIIQTNRRPLRRLATVGLMMLAGMLPSALGQKAEQDLPLVLAASLPLYPIIARAARVEGVVKIKVTTDGKKITSLEVESGPPMLARSAKENILTWKFAQHKPTTFVTTFDYAFEGTAECGYSNDAVTLNLPLKVRISAKPVSTCDPAEKIKSHPK
jgi:hypothetical protein